MMLNLDAPGRPEHRVALTGCRHALTDDLTPVVESGNVEEIHDLSAGQCATAPQTVQAQRRGLLTPNRSAGPKAALRTGPGSAISWIGSGFDGLVISRCGCFQVGTIKVEWITADD